jgi:tetratricopeptide (TPR) repeat protein
MRRSTEALADIERAIALSNGQFAGAFNIRGSVYKQIGRYEEALEDFDKAIALDNKNEWNWYHRALIHLIKSNMDDFFLDIKQALDNVLTRLQKEQSFNTAFDAALFQLVAGQFQEAKAQYTSLIEICSLTYLIQYASLCFG